VIDPSINFYVVQCTEKKLGISGHKFSCKQEIMHPINDIIAECISSRL